MGAVRKMIDRRVFLASAGAAFVTGLTERSAHALDRTDAVFAAAYKAPDGHYGMATIAENGDVIHQYRLPARGHDVVFRPQSQQAVIFARRPGTFAAIIDTKKQTAPQLITAPPGRHFYGHGCFSDDGSLLFATENDFNNERGSIGIYNAKDAFERIGALDSFGVGPHEMLFLPDQRTLVVANGGIKTHPDYPRAKLNLSTMKPNLSFINATDGELITQVALPPTMHKLSIRHLAILNDWVWFACQNEGNIQKLHPLVGNVALCHGDLNMLHLPDEQTAQLRGYVGSIAANPMQNRLAFTSPRGGVSMEVEASSGTLTRVSNQIEVCGVARTAGGFVTTSGIGVIGNRGGPLLWDNHLSEPG